MDEQILEYQESNSATLIVCLQGSELKLRTSDEHCRNSTNAEEASNLRSDVIQRAGLILNASQFLV